MLGCVYQCICLLYAKQSRIRAFGSGQENSSTMNNNSSAFRIRTAAVSAGNERKLISSLCQGSCSQCQFCTLPGRISLPTTPERKREKIKNSTVQHLFDSFGSKQFVSDAQNGHLGKTNEILCKPKCTQSKHNYPMMHCTFEQRKQYQVSYHIFKVAFIRFYQTA